MTPRAVLAALPSFGGLVMVPDAVRALLAAGDTLEQAHAALLALDEAGELELRCDAGDVEGAALCPPGPRGTVLATLRWTGAAS